MPYPSSGTTSHSASAAPPVDIVSVEAKSGEYSIAPLTARIVRVVISGFWTAPVMADFVDDMVAAIGSLPCAPEQYMVLCDCSGAAIQSQPMFAAFLSLLAEASSRPRRVALITGNPISRIQARRLIAACDRVALFEDEPPALRWLTTAA